jgi:hypothetical protein
MTSDHRWIFCTHCRDFAVICGTCGNNACNGGEGTLDDGSPCRDCVSAYALQDSGEGKPVLSDEQRHLAERLCTVIHDIGPSFAWNHVEKNAESAGTFANMEALCYQAIESLYTPIECNVDDTLKYVKKTAGHKGVLTDLTAEEAVLLDRFGEYLSALGNPVHWSLEEGLIAAR